MNGNVIREPSRSLKKQFSRNSEAWNLAMEHRTAYAGRRPTAR
jgi:hypothetical protein